MNAGDRNQSKLNIHTEIDKVDNPLSEEEIADSDDFTKETIGWKKVFLLPFEPVWEYLLLVVAYLNAIVLVVFATMSESLLLSKEIKG